MKWSILSRVFSTLLLALVIFLHLFLISKTFLIDGSGNMRVASTGYGDIPFHMTQISKFAYQKQIDFNEPIFDGERMRYSFLINMVSGYLLRFTGNWYMSIQFPAMSFMVIATSVIFLLYKNFLRSPVGAVIAIIIFLFGSGFGANWHFKNYFANYPIYGSNDFIQYLVSNTVSTITKHDAIFPEQNIAWGAPLSLVFLHQRSFFFGILNFALFMYLLTSWLKNPRSLLKTFSLGILAGIGPLGHFHTFIAMCLILGVTGLVAILERKTFLTKRLTILIFITSLVSIPQLVYLIQGKSDVISSANAFLQFRLGWMVQPTIGSIKFNSESGLLTGTIMPFFNFLWLNFGVILPIFLIAGFAYFKFPSFGARFKDTKRWWLSGICLFLLVQLFRLQPWDYDNNKIIVYFQLFAAPIFVALFLWISDKQKLAGYFLLTVFTLLATYSGFIDQIPRLLIPRNDLPVIFSRDATQTAEFIKKNISPGEDIITTSTHLNPVSSLAGRPVLVGYPGWLWTRGINYNKRENDAKLFFSNPNSFEFIADYYGVRYALIDPSAIYDWRVPIEVFESSFQLVFQNDTYRIFKLY